MHPTVYGRLSWEKCRSLYSHSLTKRCHGNFVVARESLSNYSSRNDQGLSREKLKSTSSELYFQGIYDHELERYLRYDEELIVPIIENTPIEKDLEESLAQAVKDYPGTTAVLVRRHGIYVWGDSWQKAKTQCECYDYLFNIAIEMKKFGLDPAAVPRWSKARRSTVWIFNVQKKKKDRKCLSVKINFSFYRIMSSWLKRAVHKWRCKNYWFCRSAERLRRDV